jgi:hypothetical protein
LGGRLGTATNIVRMPRPGGRLQSIRLRGHSFGQLGIINAPWPTRLAAHIGP